MDKFSMCLIIVLFCLCSVVSLEFICEDAAQAEGYNDGYYEHNETMYNYTSMYCDVCKPSDVDYYYNYGYCKGYKMRSLDDMKPER